MECLRSVKKKLERL